MTSEQFNKFMATYKGELVKIANNTLKTKTAFTPLFKEAGTGTPVDPAMMAGAPLDPSMVQNAPMPEVPMGAPVPPPEEPGINPDEIINMLERFSEGMTQVEERINAIESRQIELESKIAETLGRSSAILEILQKGTVDSVK